MWSPASYDNCVNSSLHFQSIQCAHCKFTCHSRCRDRVRIDCQGTVDGGTMLSAADPNHRTPSPLFVERNELLAKIEKYNARLKNKGSGLGMTLLDNGAFRGFIRVHLNLTRPINVVAGTRPPSIYDIINDDEAAKEPRRTLTSFYMPRDTVKNIHITSENTSLEVVKSLLKKFKVVDNAQKFALYQCTCTNGSNGSKTISGHVLKRIADHDRPLQIALDWLDSDNKKIVLQENDTADICWDAFALPVTIVVNDPLLFINSHCISGASELFAHLGTRRERAYNASQRQIHVAAQRDEPDPGREADPGGRCLSVISNRSSLTATKKQNQVSLQ